MHLRWIGLQFIPMPFAFRCLIAQQQFGRCLTSTSGPSVRRWFAHSERRLTLDPHCQAARIDPLYLRPASHEVPLQAFLHFEQWADSVCKAVGDQLLHLDAGPSSTDLQRELKWLLDDVVAAARGPDPLAPWRDTSWDAVLRSASGQPSAGAYHSMTGPIAESKHASLRLRAGVNELKDLWDRRVNDRTPLQYLTGSAHWRNLVLSVGPGVLIPRPETEQLIDFAQQAIADDASLAECVWADLGTGSGAIAIGLAQLLAAAAASQSAPSPQVYAIDASPLALEWAHFNVTRLGHGEQVKACKGNWFSPLIGLEGQLGGVISNPPYIPRSDMVGLQAEVGQHEPHSALDGGEGLGLDSLEVLCAQSATFLRTGGFLALETAGGEQAQHVAQLLKSRFVEVQIIEDMFGKARFVTALRN